MGVTKNPSPYFQRPSIKDAKITQFGTENSDFFNVYRWAASISTPSTLTQMTVRLGAVCSLTVFQTGGLKRQHHLGTFEEELWDND